MDLSETALAAAHKAYHGSAPDGVPNPHLRAAIEAYKRVEEAAQDAESQTAPQSTTPVDFDPNWSHGHVTRDGKPARILCWDAKGDQPIVAAVTHADGTESIERYELDGLYYPAGVAIDGDDLLNAPAPKRKRTVWALLRADGSWAWHPTKEWAEIFARTCKDRLIATAVPVEMEE
ncbi:MAG: hypothetical protein KGI54_18605 [Pseudomonadota bacterium]|nr:hypothetical protein [Pseudomonadota bacterium]